MIIIDKDSSYIGDHAETALANIDTEYAVKCAMANNLFSERINLLYMSYIKQAQDNDLFEKHKKAVSDLKPKDLNIN